MQQRFFDPSSTINAFAQGHAYGQGVRNSKVQNAFAQFAAENDFDGAKKFALSQGEIGLAQSAQDMISSLDEAQREQAAVRAETLARSAITLSDIKDPTQRTSAFLGMQQDLLNAGISSEDLQRFDPTDDNALKAVIDQVTPLAELLKTRAQPEYGFKVVGDDLVRTNSTTGDANVAYSGVQPVQPDWQRTTIDIDGVPTIVEYDRNAEDPRASMRIIGSEFTEPEVDAGQPDATGEGLLRREFNSLTRQFRDIHSAFNRITATDTSTPAGQMGLIFQYMKMLDPASTVREGEYATAQNTTGVPGQVLNAYNQALQGKFLTPVQIQDFENQAKRLYDRSAQIYDGQVQEYQRLALGYNFDPSRTVVDIRSGQTGPVEQPIQFPNAPPVGTVEDGYVYVGGDPALQSSWEPAG